jgi:CheY-like chemotaxis protein
LEGEVGHISLRTGIAHIASEEAHNLLPAQFRPVGDYVYLEVADTGVGMSAETIEDIFNPFYTTKFTGRGLGLSAVLGIVGNMGAGIKVESEIEKGTAFTIYFPVTETLESESEISSPLHYESKRYTGGVLLVDDEEDVLLVGKHILKSLGFKVTVARNGAHALDEFRKHPDSFRCIVLDLMMPVMDGEGALKEIRKIDENVPVVVVTGYSGTESSTRLGLKPHVTVLPKPYLIDDMVKALASILSPERS